MPGPIIPLFHAGRARLLTFDSTSAAEKMATSSITDLIEYVGERDPRPIGHWRELSSEEYARAFAVARTAGYSVVNDIYEAFLASVGSRETAREFSDKLIPLLKRKGWLNGNDGQIASRLRLIYDTNLRLARASGQWERYRRTSNALPYMRGITARDDRVRHPPKSPSDHTAWDGIVLPFSHPFWLRWFPPLGFQCRCSVVQMSRSQLARSSYSITDEADLADREARLGVPVFSSPGSFSGQLASIAAVANDERLPGQPGLDMRQARSQSQRILDATLIEEGIGEIADVLNRIFGVAA